MKRVYFSIIPIRLLLIFFWAGIIFLLLYIPSLLHLFRIKRSISIATWTDMIDATYIKKFEKETGIKVYLSYFDSNDELYIKLKATNGKEYDLVMPSDYMVKILIKEGLLKKLNKSKLTAFDEINPRLLHQYYDPTDEYSIPYYWGIYGLGYDKNFYSGIPKATWNLAFNKDILPEKVVMLGDPREAILITTQYLFGTIDDITQAKIKKIKQIMIEQKRWVEAYSEFRAEYLLASKASPLAVTSTPFIMRLMKAQKNIGFLIPKEGSFQIVDTFAIPISSTKENLVYQFLNFLYQPEVIKHHFELFNFIPATKNFSELFQQWGVNSSIYEAHFDESIKLDFFRNVFSEQQLNEIWIALKAT